MSILLSVRIFLALLLLRASAHKLLRLQQFRTELSAYRLLPTGLLTPTALGLGIVEGSCALGLLAALQSPWPLWITAALLILYAFAMAVNVWRGNTAIDCGCNGWGRQPRQLDLWLVARNVLLVLLALSSSACETTVRSAGYSLDAQTIILLMTATLVLVALYEGAEQAIANQQRYRQWLQHRGDVQHAGQTR